MPDDCNFFDTMDEIELAKVVKASMELVYSYGVEATIGFNAFVERFTSSTQEVLADMNIKEEQP